jgi:fructose-1,6-bisphosphatase/inositol monophosphatase family enzyme
MARETAVSAGDLIHEKWHQPRQTSSKGFRDLVTDADLAAQQLITNRIQQAFPSARLPARRRKYRPAHRRGGYVGY